MRKTSLFDITGPGAFINAVEAAKDSDRRARHHRSQDHLSTDDAKARPSRMISPAQKLISAIIGVVKSRRNKTPV